MIIHLSSPLFPNSQQSEPYLMCKIIMKRTINHVILLDKPASDSEFPYRSLYTQNDYVGRANVCKKSFEKKWCGGWDSNPRTATRQAPEAIAAPWLLRL